ncbi:MAG: fibronectin type III-like domain-contianing protein [Rhodospirillales bacterium]
MTRRKKTPRFPFGFGLSYSSFAYSGLRVEGGDTLTISFDVRNVGKRAGMDVPQAYVTSRAGRAGLRLVGWHKQMLQPGESAHVRMTADARLLADYEAVAHKWHVPGGRDDGGRGG